MKNYQVGIIGGGIVGLAAAHKLRALFPHWRIVVFEKEDQVAKHQTGHNSGVIHSGIYYKPGSQKAKNCMRGYRLMLDYLSEKSISHEVCGKLIVATQSEQLPQLQRLKQQGEQLGMSGLKILNRDESRQVEPYVNALEALYVPQAGIVDYKQVSDHLAKDIENTGVEIWRGHKVRDIYERRTYAEIVLENNVVHCDLIINCAGLYSDEIARMVLPNLDVQIIPFRGEYYELNKGAQKYCRNLIYPVPDARFPFLGVHLTRMIAGGVEAGPNAVLALQKEGYSWKDCNLNELLETFAWPGFYKFAFKYWKVGLSEVARSLSKQLFLKSLRELVPDLQISDLQPGGAGVRAQACTKSGQLVNDFFIEKGARSIHVLNAPSPAATSSLAIGEHVASLV